MKTHRIISIILGAALTASLAGCSKEAVGSAGQPAGQQLEKISLSATLTVPGGDTKVELGGTEGLSPLWEDGDQILVLDADMKPYGRDGLFTISAGYGTQTGTFTSEAYMLQVPTYAIYPASVYDAETKKFTLHVTQDGTIKSAVMLGKMVQGDNGFTTTFTNVCSVLKINTGDYGTGGAPAIKSVTVSAGSGIAGGFTIDWTGEAPTISPATDGTVSSNVTATAALGSYTNNTDIYIPIIPTGSQTFDFEFDFIITELKYASVSESFAVAANTINALGTAGGMEFKPQTLPGVFSVSNSKKVQFSRGNLWADSNKALHFEAKQSSFASSWDASHVSHFTWSSTVEAAVSKTPSGDYFFCDESHKVSVDGSGAIYYALSRDEWIYLFDTRTASTVSDTPNARYAKATVNGKAGLILLPDTYTHPSGVTDLTNINTTNAAYNVNNYNVAAWTAMETAGAVFLPAAGDRIDSNVSHVDYSGHYWSSTADGSTNAYLVNFYSGSVRPDHNYNRNYGYCVRLITASN